MDENNFLIAGTALDTLVKKSRCISRGCRGMRRILGWSARAMGGAVVVDTGCTAMPNHKARINTEGEDVHQGHAAPDPEDKGEGGATERAKGQGATGGAPLSLGNGTQAQNGGKAPLDRVRSRTPATTGTPRHAHRHARWTSVSSPRRVFEIRNPNGFDPTLQTETTWAAFWRGFGHAPAKIQKFENPSW